MLRPAREAAALALCVVFAPATAEQVSHRVRSSCTGDYMAYCSGTTNAQQGFTCMLKVGPRLSRPGLVALIKDSYVTRAEVLRRARMVGIDVGYLPGR